MRTRTVEDACPYKASAYTDRRGRWPYGGVDAGEIVEVRAAPPFAGDGALDVPPAPAFAGDGALDVPPAPAFAGDGALDVPPGAKNFSVALANPCGIWYNKENVSKEVRCEGIDCHDQARVGALPDGV